MGDVADPGGISRGIYCDQAVAGRINSMWRSVQLTVLASILLCAASYAQEQSTGVPLEQTTPVNPAQPITPGALLQQNQQQQQTAGAHPNLYHELDLLRRDGFAASREATVSLRVVNHDGFTPPNLDS